MQFSIRLLLFVMLFTGLTANVIRMKQTQNELKEEIPGLTSASSSRSIRLQNFEEKNYFHQKFLEAHDIHKAKSEGLLKKLNEVAVKNSRIVPDDSGRYFWRRFIQPEEGCRGARVWVPELARIQITVGFTDNRSNVPSSKQPLRASSIYLPAEIWSVPLPPGESTLTWQVSKEKEMDAVEIIVNDQKRIFRVDTGGHSQRGWERKHGLNQQAIPSDQSVRLFGYAAGSTRPIDDDFVVDTLCVVIEPVGARE